MHSASLSLARTGGPSPSRARRARLSDLSAHRLSSLRYRLAVHRSRCLPGPCGCESLLWPSGQSGWPDAEPTLIVHCLLLSSIRPFGTPLLRHILSCLLSRLFSLPPPASRLAAADPRSAPFRLSDPADPRSPGRARQQEPRDRPFRPDRAARRLESRRRQQGPRLARKEETGRESPEREMFVAELPSLSPEVCGRALKACLFTDDDATGKMMGTG